MPTRRRSPRWLAEVEQVDRAVYAAVAGTPTPSLDVAMRRLSRAADHSKLSIAASVVLATAGGPDGRRAAARGLTAIAATSAFVNLVVKPVGGRRRPDRVRRERPGRASRLDAALPVIPVRSQRRRGRIRIGGRECAAGGERAAARPRGTGRPPRPTACTTRGPDRRRLMGRRSGPDGRVISRIRAWL